MPISNKEIDDILNKYKSKLDQETGGNSVEEYNPSSDFSKEYGSFRKEALGKKLSTYEKLCNFSEGILKAKPSEKDVEKIAHIQIARLIRNLKEKEIDLSVSDKALSFIAKKGYVKEFGARPLKRAIQDYISVPLSQYILKDQSSKKIKVDIAKDKISIN